jgi:chemotaxis methyl-accepting protein methylase
MVDKMPINKISNILMQFSNIDISIYDVSFLEKSVQKRMAETCSGSLAEYIALLEQNGGERTAFIDSLHISYSEFFRNPLTFAVLERIILPALVLKKKTSRKEIRIWSAACAGGQEAYSLAILLEELKNGDMDQFSYRIFATDQSDAQVNEASKGHYASAALHNVSLKRAAEWFTRQGDIYIVKPELKENMEFSTFDLFNDSLSCPPASIFGGFDLVICANFLFYYKSEYRTNILKKAVNSLAEGGYLMTGETEREIVARNNLHELVPQAAIFHRLMPRA